MAFPTTSVLDTFSVNASLSTGSWATPIFNGDSTLVALDGECVGQGGFCDSYWSASTFGADSEAYCKVVNAIESGGNAYEVLCRISNPNGAVNNYFIHVLNDNSNVVWMYKTVSGSQTKLGADVTQAIAAGDSIGISAIGTTISFWHKPAAGSWTEVATRTDSSVTGAGYIGLAIQGTSVRLDDFGGGTVVPASGFQPAWAFGSTSIVK